MERSCVKIDDLATSPCILFEWSTGLQLPGLFFFLKRWYSESVKGFLDTSSVNNLVAKRKQHNSHVSIAFDYILVQVSLRKYPNNSPFCSLGNNNFIDNQLQTNPKQLFLLKG